MPLPDISNVASGYVTCLAAAGLVVLGLKKIYDGDVVNGLSLIGIGLGYFGIRRAISKVPETVADTAETVAKKLAKEECKNNGSSTPY